MTGYEKSPDYGGRPLWPAWFWRLFDGPARQRTPVPTQARVAMLELRALAAAETIGDGERLRQLLDTVIAPIGDSDVRNELRSNVEDAFYALLAPPKADEVGDAAVLLQWSLGAIEMRWKQ